MLTTEPCRLPAVILCLALCSGLAVSPPGLQAQETGIDKKLKVNDQMTIELPANPSTGFRWQVEYDKDYLDLLAEDYRTGKEPGDPRVGVGGTSCFTFRALKAGLTKVSLKYQQPWRPKPVRVKTYNVLIN
jgi:inhibitor of cysteine peptidase